MDVQCSRCGIEYDFDDALVSGQGTMVECTSCGHRFQVFPSAAEASLLPDRWVVTTVEGRHFAFHALRELQRSILAGDLQPGDRVARGQLASRPLGAILELLPFFEESARRDEAAAATQTDPPTEAPETTRSPSARPDGFVATAPKPEASPLPHLGPRPTPVQAPGDAVISWNFDRVPPPRARMATPSGLGTFPMATVPSPAPSSGPVAGARQSNVEMLPPPLPAEARGAGAFYAFHHETSPPVAHYSQEPPLEPLPYRTWSPLVQNTVLVAVGAALAFGGMVGLGWRRFAPLGEVTSALSSGPVTPADERVSSLVAAAQRALSEGDLEAAKEAYDKASVWRDSDPAILLGLARIACWRADVAWLRLRLVAGDAAPVEMLAAQRDLKEQLERAKQTSERALTLAPHDPSVLRTRVDALRLAEDLGAARTLSARLTDPSADAETAYVLAALDLAEGANHLSRALERLRFAAKSEVNPGRARAALVYVFAKTGDRAGARAELATMALSLRSHPLQGALRTWLAAAPETVAPTAAPHGRAGNEATAAKAGANKRSDNFKEDELQQKLKGASP